MEALECRRLLTAEGDAFPLETTLESIGLVGSPSAVVNWGDGAQTPATISSGPVRGPLKARIDYSLDTSGFFGDPARRNLLQLAADTVVGVLGDSLAAIVPGGGNTWTAVLSHPASGAVHQLTDLTIAKDELLLFAGARALSASSLGLGGFGGFSSFGSAAFNETVQTRGQVGAKGASPTDFATWGGSIAFDTTANWYFGTSTTGLPADRNDFLTVAMHEIAHVLGFGTAPSWMRLVSAGTFTGPRSVAAFDGSGNVPLSDSGHWAVDTEDVGRETLMDPDITVGTRKFLTPLDVAGLDDLGWDLVSTAATVTAQRVYADNGNYPISVSLRGSTAGEVSATRAATISNANPTLTATGAKTVRTGTELQITDVGAISDPGFANASAPQPTVETFTYTINWGDETPVENGTATIDRTGGPSLPTLASFDGQHVFANAGVYTVQLVVRDDDGGTANASFQVTVENAPRLELSLSQDTVFENDSAGEASLTIRRVGSGDQPLTVSLSSDDTTELTVPATVSFAAGETQKSVSLTPVDDALLDGDIQVGLRAAAPGAAEETIQILVRDFEFLEATIDSAAIAENAGAAATQLRVRRSNTNTAAALQVSLSGIDNSEIAIANPITIPAGSQSVLVPIGIVDDNLQDGFQDVQLQLSAAGYQAAGVLLTVVDDEPSPYQNEEIFDVDGNGTLAPIDALRVINELNRSGGARRLVPGQDPAGTVFYDVNGDYLISPIDALRVINRLNRIGPIGDPEAAAAAHDAALEAFFLPNPDDDRLSMLEGPGSRHDL